MVIDKIGNINNIAESKNNKKAASVSSSGKNDSIHLSVEGKQAAEAARYLKIVSETPDIRAERVKEIKDKIAAGTYDFNDSKIIENVADRIAGFLLKE